MKQSIEYTNFSYWMKIRHAYACGIELTPYCNFHCVHCYLQNGEYTQYLSGDEIKEILDILFDVGILFVYFTGGEIFTRKDFLDIYLYAKKKGFLVELLTNISLLDNKILDVFKRYPPATISISVYGASEETYQKVTKSSGNYQKVMQALQLLADAQLHFEIKFIGLKCNLDDFQAVENLARKYKVDFKHSFELFPTLNGDTIPFEYMLTPKEIVDFEKKYAITANRWASRCFPSPPSNDKKLFACDIAQSSFIIDCEGHMEPCNKLRLKKYKILDLGFQPIWEEFAKYKQMEVPVSFQCLSCDVRSICTPCPAENLLTTGRLDIPAEHMCKIAKARVDEFSNSRYDCLRE